ncbi:MAG: type IV pilus secretin PilQ [Elusimicrobiales bacterium]
MKLILSLMTIVSFYALGVSETVIEDVSFGKNILTIKYSGDKIKYSVKNTKNPLGINIEISGSRFKILKDQPVNSDTAKRIYTSQNGSVSLISVETLMDIKYLISEKEKEVNVALEPNDFGKTYSQIEDVKVIPPTEKKKTSFSSDRKDIIDMLPKYKIDLDYSDVDVRDVLRHLAAKAGINIIFSNEVVGTISVSLRGVPFDEAFRTILNMKGLVTQQVGDNILKVSTPQKLLDEQKNSFLQTKVFFLNYVKASDIKSQIESIAQAEGRTTSKCNVDETNNALIVTDTPLGIELTERLVKKLDRMPKQVLIEAKLVEVSLDSGLHTGIQWSVSGNSNGNYIGANDASAAIGPISQWGGAKSISANYEGSYTGTPPNLVASKGGSGVELPAKEIYGAFRFGRITSNFMFDAVISAAAKKGKAKVLSNPKIATLNNKEASINITNQIPYTTTEITNTSGGSVSSTKVTYVTTGIILKVLPTITSDGRIVMKVNPTVSQPSQAAQFQPPSVDQRTADTTVVVQDGETVVIGGLIHDSESEYEYKVPVLGDIPIIGYAFKKKGKERNRMELLIFVTPKVLED